MSIPQEERAEVLAQRFHEAYERLAPNFGYRTRPETAKAWEAVPANNRALMKAVIREVVLDALEQAEAREAVLRRLLAFALPFAEDQADEEWFPAIEEAHTALSSPSPAQDLLERVRRLEEVAEAARSALAGLEDAYESESFPPGEWHDAATRLSTALSALDQKEEPK